MKVNDWKRNAIRISRSLLILVVLVPLQTPVFAEVASGSLSGTVVDATGAVIPKADMALTHK